MERIKIPTRNDIFQILEVYKGNRAKRTKAKKIFVEGVIPINLLLENSYEVDAVVCKDFNQLSKWAKEIIQRGAPKNLYELSNELMEELSSKENTSEIIVIATQPVHKIEEENLKRIAILDRPSNQGNLGAIIRSCDAFGIDAIFLSGHSVDHFDPKTISSSRGTVFKIPIHKLQSNKDLSLLSEELHQKHNFIFYGTSAKGTKNIREGIDREKNIGLIIGNETTGMNEFLTTLSDEILTIPMNGVATSMNVACAASVLLYEITQPE